MKKVVLLNCLAAFVFFNVCILLISCAKKKAEEIRKPAAGVSAKTDPAAPKKFTPVMVVEAIEHVAQKLPAAEREDFLQDSLLRKLYQATDNINESVWEGELKVTEFSSKALGEALYQSMKGPAGAKGRDAANRIKCVNNLSQIYKSMISFAQDNAERMPWQLTPSGVRNHLDAAANPSAGYGRQKDAGSNILNHHPKTGTVGGVFGMVAVKVELQTPKILLSPCDPGRKAANELIQKNWESYDAKAGKLVPHNGLSYGLCLGADTQRPLAVLATTRNLSTDDLATAKWIGGEDKLRGMLGLKTGEGQKVQMDGSAQLASDNDIGEDGKVVKWAREGRNGVAGGKTSTKMMLPYDTE
jgi:hypothetical protein